MSLELRDISLKVDGQDHIYPSHLILEKGTMNVLLGPTLSGKTSLLRLMAGLDLPSSGQIFWQGEDVTGMRVQDRQIAMVYQQFINYPSMSVYDNIASPLKIQGISAAQIDARVKEFAELLKLDEFLDRRPLELSGGQQQRCALARALVKGSGLVLLDEPLANLDYKLREELRAEIPKMFAESGAIFVYATTEPEEALLLGGNTATLWEGKITQYGPSTEVYHQPKDMITAKVFSNPPMNFLRVEKKGDSLSVDQQQLPAMKTFDSLADGIYMAGFRPNHLELSKHSEQAVAFNVQLDVTEITGSETFLHVYYGEQKWIGHVHGIHELKLGSQIAVYLDPAHIFVFSEQGELIQAAQYAPTKISNGLNESQQDAKPMENSAQEEDN